jgi:hypothetical protein
MMLVEPRHVRERRLRPQAGCDIQLPEFTAEAPMKRFCSSAEAPSTGIAANCSGGKPESTLRLSSCLSKGFVDHVVGAGSSVLDGA